MEDTRSRRFFRIRVGVLLAVLAVVVLYAVASVRSRRARNDWKRPLNVALVVVREGAVDEAAIAGFRARVPFLAERLTGELHRHRATPVRAFDFVVRGPVVLHAPLPRPLSDGTLDLAKHAWALSRWVSTIDKSASLSGDAYDARVYIVIRPPSDEKLRFVEGVSQQGGRIGTLEVDLDDSMVDYALFVTAHELLHTLGALDKYDATGVTSIPEGLAEPDASPRFPQRFAEVMSRGRVLAPGRDEAPDALEFLRVNATTAREIGWLAP